MEKATKKLDKEFTPEKTEGEKKTRKEKKKL